VIADGYFEWKKTADRKQPYYFQVDNGSLFAFAGIWDKWDPGKDGSDAIESCAIITTRANDLSQSVHERMPVILSQDSWDVWIRDAQYDRSQQHTLLSLISPFPDVRMSAVPVSTVVNNARNDSPDCVEAIGPELSIDESS
jgi:putative SOS response-associated peptidase YedK